MPKRVTYFASCILAVAYFMFEGGVGNRNGILPIDYSYFIFAIGTILAWPFVVRWRIKTNVFVTLVCLLSAALVASIVSENPATFMYAMGPLFLVIAWNPLSFSDVEQIAKKYAKHFAFLLLASGTIGFLFFVQNKASGRYFLSNVTNPNYTSMLYFAAFLAVRVATQGLRGSQFTALRVWSWMNLIISLALTGTRSTILGVLVVVFMTFAVRAMSTGSVRFLAFLAVLLSAFGQLLIYYLFQIVESADGGRGGLTIFDGSNRERVTAYFTMFGLVVGNPNFYFSGVGDVSAVWNIFGDSIDNVPHNWFMMMWVASGALYTLTLFLILILSCFRLPLSILPAYCGIMISAGIIGRAALYSPLIVICVGALIGAAFGGIRARGSRSATGAL